MSNNYQHHVLGEGNILHPSNQEQVLELTPEEEFYQIENPTNEDYDIYIESLERKLKSANERLNTKNRLTREALNAMKIARPNDLGIYKELLTEAINV